MYGSTIIRKQSPHLPVNTCRGGGVRVCVCIVCREMHWGNKMHYWESQTNCRNWLIFLADWGGVHRGITDFFFFSGGAKSLFLIFSRCGFSFFPGRNFQLGRPKKFQWFPKSEKKGLHQTFFRSFFPLHYSFIKTIFPHCPPSCFNFSTFPSTF